MAETTTEAAPAAPATNVFDKHVQDENAKKNGGGINMPWSVRILIFLAFPFLVGVVGLYMGYLESLRKPERELSFDVDFVVPFLLAFAFASVIAFQTRGFTTNKVEPLVKWPKVRKKKVIRKVRNEDLDENDEIVENEEQDQGAKKAD